MARGIKRKVKKALARVSKEIEDNRGSGDLFSRGLASEGYAGGYAAALRHVLLALDGTGIDSRYWSRND